MVTGLQLTAIVKESGKKLSELAEIMQVYPQVLINAKVKTENKDKYMDDEELNRWAWSGERCGSGCARWARSP